MFLHFARLVVMLWWCGVAVVLEGRGVLWVWCWKDVMRCGCGVSRTWCGDGEGMVMNGDKTVVFDGVGRTWCGDGGVSVVWCPKCDEFK